MSFRSCAYCKKLVSCNQEALECGICSRWQHRKCHTGVTVEMYNHFKRGAVEIILHCFHCFPTLDNVALEEPTESTEDKKDHIQKMDGYRDHYPPHKFPVYFESHPESAKINDLVRKSYQLQVKHRVSNACSVVCCTLWKCLKAFKLETVIKYGMLKLIGVNVGHMWLDYDGEIIDSTYVEDLPEDILEKMPREYVEFSEKIKDQIFLGDEVTQRHKIPDHEIELFLWAQKYPERFIVTGLNLDHIGCYMTDLIEYVNTQYSKNITVDLASQQKVCWSCDLEKESLKRCSKCLTAMYCSKECQIKDWKTVHKKACFKTGIDHRSCFS